MTTAYAGTIPPLRGKEQRKYPRYDIQILADLRLNNGNRYNGSTHNISSNGAFFAYDNLESIKKETPCTLTLYVEGNLHSDEITINCVFKPHKSGGAGLQFKTMSTNDFINFIFMLSKEFPDPDKFISEISTNPSVGLLEEQ